VRWINQRLIGKLHQLVVQRVVEMAAEFLGGPAEGGAQVGPTDVADEQGVPGEDCVRFIRVFLEVEQENRDRFDRVPRSLQDLQVQSRELERIAVFHRDKLVLGLGSRSEADLCAAAVAQLEMSGEKVGVEVSEKNIADLHSQLLGVVQVLLNIPLRIDHDCRSAGFVGNQVGRVGEAAEVILLQEHAANSRSPRLLTPRAAAADNAEGVVFRQLASN
jgi:hypothetical protein